MSFVLFLVCIYIIITRISVVICVEVNYILDIESLKRSHLTRLTMILTTNTEERGQGQDLVKRRLIVACQADI